MSEEQSLANIFLQRLYKENIQVSIFLVNGIKLQGHIDAFDDRVIVLKNSTLQLVFKHAISTIVPNKNLSAPESS